MPNPEYSREYTPRSARAQELIDFTRNELDCFRSGELLRISTDEELKTRFGYATVGSFHPLLQKAGLVTERRALFLETGGERLSHSAEAAWILGVLSGRGSVGNNGKICLLTQNEEFADAFKSVGDSLFRVDMRILPKIIEGKEYREARFDDRRVTRMLGDFKKEDGWTQTMREKHQWALENEEFMWRFLEGYCEARGVVDRKGLTIGTGSTEVADFLTELIQKLGLEQPHILKKSGKLRGIAIRNPQDIEKIAKCIHTHNPEKEKALDMYRVPHENIVFSAPSNGDKKQRKSHIGKASKPETDQVMESKQIEELPIHEDELITPSLEWAWMMGIIAGGGNISSSGRISFMQKEEKLRVAIKSRGERLFGINANIPPLYVTIRTPTIEFNTTKYARALGNFTRDAWVETILNRHAWMTRDNRYMWAFLEGIFETKGHFDRIPRKKHDNLELNTGYLSSANFLAELLVRVGIENPKIRTANYAREGIAGVVIASLKDIKHFAAHVHSVIPNVEGQLAFYRDVDPEQLSKVVTPEDIIKEWSRITTILGHTPTRRDVNLLKTLGLTEFGEYFYTSRFDSSDSKKNFTTAQENLVREAQNYKFEWEAEELEITRNKYDEYLRGIGQKRSSAIYSDEEIIEEWVKARDLLGHLPNSYEIQQLKKEGRIRLSHRAFLYRFGDKRSFTTAQAALEEIIRVRGGN